MSAQPTATDTRAIVYPESDGQAMADNTVQFRWIVTLVGGLEALFRDRPDVFVAGDLLWYPVEGCPDLRVAPDALVVFGRPKGDRGSYMQWREDGVAPQVVFEVLSPGNRPLEMLRKLNFYQHYGVEEFYIYDPDAGELEGFVRDGDRLLPVEEMNGWASPRLGITFGVEGVDLVLTRPNGRRFASYLELERERQEAQQQAEQERQRAERLAARLRALGVDPDEPGEE
ncbi:MAG: Uma2 family endonuclease [Roseiflexaceae bacterium]